MQVNVVVPNPLEPQSSQLLVPMDGEKDREKERGGSKKGTLRRSQSAKKKEYTVADVVQYFCDLVETYGSVCVRVSLSMLQDP